MASDREPHSRRYSIRRLKYRLGNQLRKGGRVATRMHAKA